MKIKRLFSALLVLCLSICLLTFSASAAEVASGTCGENATWVLDDAGTLTISGSGSLDSYYSFNLPWKDYTKSIKKAVVVEGITDLTNYAFYNCSNLTTVSLPDSLTMIPNYAFQYCSSLSSITLPETIQRIGMYSFGKCQSLRSITIPASVEYITQSAFSECTNLAQVTFKEAPAVMSMARGGYASGLSISINAFYNCQGITRIDLPSHLSSVDGDAFKGCLNLTGIWADTTQTLYGVEGPKYKTDSRGVLYEYDCDYDYDRQVATYYPYMLSCVPAQLSGEYSIYPTVRSIDGSFYGCSKLTGLTFTKDAGGINNLEAFTGCTSLVRVTAGAGNEDGWYNDASGALIQDSGSQVSLAFVPANVTDYTIGSDITYIYECAFAGGKMKNISVASGNTKYTSVNGILYNADVTTLIAYPAASTAEKLYLPASVTYLQDSSFANARNLKHIWITGEKLVSMGSDAFSGTSVTIHYPEYVEMWEYYIQEMNATSGSNVTFVPYGAAPEAPSIAVSGINSTGKNKLSWNKVDGAVNYEVWYATSKSGTYKKATMTSETSYTHSGASAGKTYYYYVLALDADNNASEQSNIVSRTCDLARPVVTLSNVASSGKIKISWEKINGAVNYEVYRATSKTGTYSLIKTTTGTSLTNTSTTAGKTYYYKVKALAEKSAANSADSEIKSRTCKLARPVVTVSNVEKTGKVKLSWDAIEGAESYKVYRATFKNGPYSLMKTSATTSYTNTSAEAGQTYYYKVKAVGAKSAADSADSEIKSRTCDLARPVVTLSNIASSGKIKISWEAIDGAVKYEVYRSDAKDGTYTKLTTTSNTSVNNTSTTAGTTYYYKVKAIAETPAANSAYSEIKGRTCDLPRPAISVSLSSGKPKVTWEKIDGAVSYKIYRATSKDGTYTLMKTSNGSSYTNTSAVAGKTYYYKVVAVCSNTAGNSADSKVVSIKATK